jgi:hypothetical protein
MSDFNFEIRLYAPDWQILPPTSDRLSQVLRSLFCPQLKQLRFSSNGETFDFPDFDNIFSRSELAGDWWLLPPEQEGKLIWPEDDWLKILQPIYEQTIVKKINQRRNIPMFFPVQSNILVDELTLNLSAGFDFMATDERNSNLSIYHYQKVFESLRIRKNWRSWLLCKATVRYYHRCFEPDLIDGNNIRKSARLSNRFPEYKEAVERLCDFRQWLYKRFQSDWASIEEVDRFFDRQEKDNAIQRKEFEENIAGLAPISFFQCRVCGGVKTKKIEEVGKRKKGGKERQVCSTECGKAWDYFRKALPINPHDPEVGQILISQI